MHHTISTQTVATNGNKTNRTCWRAFSVFMCTLAVIANSASAETKGTQRVAKRVPTARSKAANAKLVRALDIATKCKTDLQRIKDYSATFSKRERIGNNLLTQKLNLKVRHKPFSVYLKFQSPHAGREVIFFDGRNNGMLLAHGTGIESIVGTLRILPTSKDAMQETRYPLTQIGMLNMVESLSKQWESELKYADIEVKYFPNATVANTKCKAIQTTHTKRRPGVAFQVSRLYIDQKSNLPIRVEQFGFPKQAGGKKPLIEEYTYTNIRLNMGLKDIDFETRNSNYDY